MQSGKLTSLGPIHLVPLQLILEASPARRTRADAAEGMRGGVSEHWGLTIVLWWKCVKTNIYVEVFAYIMY